MRDPLVTIIRADGLSFEVDDALRGIMTFGWLEADGVSHAALPAAFMAERDTISANSVS